MTFDEWWDNRLGSIQSSERCAREAWDAALEYGERTNAQHTQPAILLEDLENILFVEWCAWERIGEKNWVKHVMKKIRLYAKQQAGA